MKLLRSDYSENNNQVVLTYKGFFGNTKKVMVATKNAKMLLELLASLTGEKEGSLKIKDAVNKSR
jgi:hypothetical protein